MTKGTKRQHKKQEKARKHKYYYTETKVYEGNGKSRSLGKKRIKRTFFLKKGPKGKGLIPVDSKGHPIKIKNPF